MQNARRARTRLPPPRPTTWLLRAPSMSSPITTTPALFTPTLRLIHLTMSHRKHTTLLTIQFQHTTKFQCTTQIHQTFVRAPRLPRPPPSHSGIGQTTRPHPPRVPRSTLSHSMTDRTVRPPPLPRPHRATPHKHQPPTRDSHAMHPSSRPLVRYQSSYYYYLIVKLILNNNKNH